MIYCFFLLKNINKGKPGAAAGRAPGWVAGPEEVGPRPALRPEPGGRPCREPRGPGSGKEGAVFCFFCFVFLRLVSEALGSLPAYQRWAF